MKKNDENQVVWARPAEQKIIHFFNKGIFASVAY